MKQKKKGCVIFMYSVSKTFLGGTVTRITLAPETRLCGKSLERLSLDPSLKMLGSNLIMAFKYLLGGGIRGM